MHAQFEQMTCRRYNTSHGLPSNDVYAIYQDKYDLMWFGTTDGISLFNGYEFENYGLPDLPNELFSLNAVSAIAEDHDGNILVGTHFGYAKFLRIEREYQYYPSQFPDRANVNMFYTDSKGQIWAAIGGNHGLVNIEENIVYDGKRLNEKTFKQITGIFELSPGIFIANSYSFGIFVVDISKNTCHRIFPDSKTKPFILRPYAMRAISKDSIWVHAGDGIFLFSFPKDTIEDYTITKKKSLENNPADLRQYFHLIDNRYFCFTDNNTFLSYKIDNNAIDMITDWPCFENDETNTIRTVFTDRQKNIWLGHVNNGISLLTPQKAKYRLFSSGSAYPSCLSDTQVKKAIEVDSTTYLLSTKGGGINLIDLKNMSCEHFTTYINNRPLLARNKDQFSLLYKTHEGEYLAGNDMLGLFSVDMENRKTTNKLRSRALNQIKRKTITAICEDNMGFIWFGTQDDGLFKIDTKKDELSHHYFVESNDENSKLIGNHISTLFIDKNGRMWIGTNNGLNILENNKLYSFQHTEASNTIWSNQVLCIYQATDNTIWTGTNNGLNKWNEKTKAFIRLERDRNQNSNIIQSIIEDANGDIWVATKNGLTSIREKDNIIIHLTPSDGFLQAKTATNGLTKTSSNEILAATTSGLLAFNPNNFYIDNLSPKQYLQKITISRKKNHSQQVIPLEILDTTKVVNLTYTQNTITFEYNTLSYINANRTQYEYMLQGLDKDWIWVGNNHKTTYANLNPGKYVFRFRSQNNIGVWNAEPFELAINIKPPFWYRLSFRIFLFTLIALLLLYIPLRRMRKVRNQNIVLEKAIAERTSELQTQHDKLKKQTEELKEANATKDKLFRILAHDLKDPFNQILGFSELLLLNFNKYDEQKRYSRIKLIYTSSKRFYGLLDNILSWSRAHNKRISYHPGDILLKPIIEEAIHFLQDLADNKGLEINLEIPERLVVHADKYLIATVLRNLTSNAIKFSYKGSRIDIYATPINNHVKISIRDYGVGMDLSTKESLFSHEFHQSKSGTSGESGTGLGLIICKDFIERNQGILEIISHPDEGSIFSFTLPLVEW